MSSSEDVKFSNVCGLYLRKYGKYISKVGTYIKETTVASKEVIFRGGPLYLFAMT